MKPKRPVPVTYTFNSPSISPSHLSFSHSICLLCSPLYSSPPHSSLLVLWTPCRSCGHCGYSAQQESFPGSEVQAGLDSSLISAWLHLDPSLPDSCALCVAGRFQAPWMGERYEIPQYQNPTRQSLRLWLRFTDFFLPKNAIFLLRKVFRN